MNRVMNPLTTLIAGLLLAACGDSGVDEQSSAAEQAVANDPPVAALAPDEKYNVTAKPSGPVKISYRIIGTPIVGQPVTIDLQVESRVGDMPITLSYETNDSTAMTFPEAQLQSVSLTLVDDERMSAQQVTVIPMREGRLFLNVGAVLQTETGSLQTVTAIPIQVGSAPRVLQENGVVTTDENGELLREMPASES